MSVAAGFAVVLACYLTGSIPFGYLIARRHGINIFQHGSGNIGATNVWRTLGPRLGALVFILDFLKGAVPAAVGLLLDGEMRLQPAVLANRGTLGVVSGLAAVAGHMFPVFLRFRGGKGVATGAGVVCVLLPVPAVGAVVTWLAVVASSRYVSLASMAAAASLCVLRFLLTTGPFGPDNRVLTAFCLIAAGLVCIRHRGNVVRLCRGTENRLRESTAMLVLAKVIHLLAVGFWFGSGIFFSFVVALTLFRAFEGLAARPADQRPLWFPLPQVFQRDLATQKEQGTRAAGEAVSPMFDWYFFLQGVCGFLAVATALAWWKEGGSVDRVRVVLIMLALATVMLGWPLEKKVSQLRLERGRASDAVLLAPAPVPAELEAQATKARGEFGRWHVYSLLLNFATIMLVTTVMILAAWLPCASATAAPPADMAMTENIASPDRP